MLTVVQGNRLETLAERLVAVLRADPLPPLVPEIVVVQSGGMARWLAMRIASRLGVCANVRFPFPAALLWEIARALVPGVPAAPALEPAVMTWHLLALLAAHRARGRRRAPPLRARAPARRSLRSVPRLPAGLDRCLGARRGDALAGGAVAASGRARARGAPDAKTAALPARIAIFGISALPPAELEAFARLATHIDVRLFVLNPCR